MRDTCSEMVLISKADRFFEFGCLYDLTVDVLPVSGTTVVQVLPEQAFPTSVDARPMSPVLADVPQHHICRIKRVPSREYTNRRRKGQAAQQE